MPRDAGYVFDILKYGKRAVGYLQSRTLDDFLDDQQLQDAAIRSLEVMGEASKRVSMAYRDDHPDIPWRRIAGLRDVLIHQYGRVNTREIWRVITEDVTSLLPVLDALVKDEELDMEDSGA